MIQIDTSDRILLDGHPTGLALRQVREGTVIYTPEIAATGQRYKVHKMPHARYSLANDAPRPMHATPELAAKYPAPAGRAQFEADVRDLIASL